MNNQCNENNTPYININYGNMVKTEELHEILPQERITHHALMEDSLSVNLKFASDYLESERKIQMLQEDLVAHVHYATQGLKIPMSIIKNDGSWADAAKTLKVNSDSVQSLVSPIELYKPASIVVVDHYTSQDDQGSKVTSLGYYMVDEDNQFFAKVVCIIDHNQHSLIDADNSVEDLFIEARLVERMSCMYENMPEYFALKYNYLFTVLSA